MRNAHLFVALSCCTLAGTALGAEPALKPTIHDWSVRNECVPETPEIVPVPHPGWDADPTWWVYAELWQKMIDENLPVTFMLQDGTAPITGQESEVLLQVLDMLPKVDVVYADFETSAQQLNEYWMVFYTRTHWNPEISNAWIGSYKSFAGEYDESQLTPSAAFRGFESDFYVSSGLDVAMPNCYPYDDFQVHTWSSVWGSEVCPSIRYAMLWAPVHRASVSKLALPQNHLLIPWIASFAITGNYGPVEPPPKEDNVALLQHLRMRGVDGYYTLVSNTPGYTSAEYRMDMLAAWQDLDEWFAEGPVQVLNHTTDKVGGVLWSGVQSPAGTAVLVSNFSGADATFTLPGGPWPGGGTVVVPHGTHSTFTLPASQGEEEVENNPDLNEDGLVNSADVGLMLADWGPCQAALDCPADLNDDGLIDSSDLGILLAAWSQ